MDSPQLLQGDGRIEPLDVKITSTIRASVADSIKPPNSSHDRSSLACRATWFA
jgi:hypothetical protein